MWGTPQRSRRTVTGPSSPPRRIVPFTCGSGRRASQVPGSRRRGARQPGAGRGRDQPASQRPPSALASRHAYLSISFDLLSWPADQEAGPPPRASAGGRPSPSPPSAAAPRRDVAQASASSAALGALAALEGGEQAALAHLAVLDVLGQLRRRVLDPGPVARADQLERLGLQQRAASPCRRRASRRRAARRSSPRPSTRSPLKQTPSAVRKQTWSAAWPGVARARRPPCSSPSPGRTHLGARACSAPRRRDRRGGG